MARRSKKIKTSNVALVIVSVTLILFTVYMCQIFKETGAVPDTLITCVFAVCGTECGALAWIRTSKEKYKEREWQKQDEKEAEKKVKRRSTK